MKTYHHKGNGARPMKPSRERKYGLKQEDVTFLDYSRLNIQLQSLCQQDIPTDVLAETFDTKPRRWAGQLSAFGYYGIPPRKMRDAFKAVASQRLDEMKRGVYPYANVRLPFMPFLEESE